MILFCVVCCAIAFYMSKLLKFESRMHPNEIMKKTQLNFLVTDRNKQKLSTVGSICSVAQSQETGFECRLGNHGLDIRGMRFVVGFKIQR